MKGIKGRSKILKKRSRFEPINFQLLGNPDSESVDETVFESWQYLLQEVCIFL